MITTMMKMVVMMVMMMTMMTMMMMMMMMIKRMETVGGGVELQSEIGLDSLPYRYHSKHGQ